MYLLLGFGVHRNRNGCILALGIMHVLVIVSGGQRAANVMSDETMNASRETPSNLPCSMVTRCVT